METNSSHIPFGLRMAKVGSIRSTLPIKVGACLIDKGRIIIAWNRKRTSPAASKLYRWPNQAHAEFLLFARTTIRGNEIIDISPTPSSKGTIYVYRETADGEFAMARPCEWCMGFLGRIGIRSVVYTVNKYWRKEKI